MKSSRQPSWPAQSCLDDGVTGAVKRRETQCSPVLGSTVGRLLRVWSRYYFFSARYESFFLSVIREH